MVNDPLGALSIDMSAMEQTRLYGQNVIGPIYVRTGSGAMEGAPAQLLIDAPEICAASIVNVRGHRIEYAGVGEPFYLVLEEGTKLPSIALCARMDDPDGLGELHASTSLNMKSAQDTGYSHDRPMDVDRAEPLVPVGRFMLEKLDSDCDTMRLAGAAFDIYDAQGMILGELVSCFDTLAISRELPFGIYQLIEKRAPLGYELYPTPQYVTVDSAYHMHTLRVTGVRKPRRHMGLFVIHLEATPRADAPRAPRRAHVQLGGAIAPAPTQLDMWGDSQAARLAAARKPDLSGARFEVYAMMGGRVAEIETDGQGVAKSPLLPLGVYRVMQSAAPVGLAAYRGALFVTLAASDYVTRVDVMNAVTERQA